MPFKSKRQQRFMYATKPKGVDLKEWSKETDFSKLPEKVRKSKKKKDKDKKDKGDVVEIDIDVPANAIDKTLDLASEFERQAKLS